MAVQERETTKEVKHMSLKAGYKGIKETGEGINLDQEGSLSLDPGLNNILCKEETAGTYTLSATVAEDGSVTYAWTVTE